MQVGRRPASRCAAIANTAPNATAKTPEMADVMITIRISDSVRAMPILHPVPPYVAKGEI